MAFVANTSKWKLGGAIWIAGMIGVLAATFIMLPVLISQHPPRNPLRLSVWVVGLWWPSVSRVWGRWCFSWLVCWWCGGGGGWVVLGARPVSRGLGGGP